MTRCLTAAICFALIASVIVAPTQASLGPPVQLGAVSGQDAKFIGTAVSRIEDYNYAAWLVDVQQVLFGYPISGQVEVITFMAAGPPPWCTSGYVDPNIAPGDQVEVFAYQNCPGGSPVVCSSDSYYIRKIAASCPSAPHLYSIDNPECDGTYLVHWNRPDGATASTVYTLEEDDNSSFQHPTVVYRDIYTLTQIGGRGAGTYYYRVKAANAGCESSWSNVESVVVCGCDYVATDFDPWDDGFKFDNFGTIGVGDWKGNCTGMSLAALDFFYNPAEIPQEDNEWCGYDVDPRTALSCYVVWRHGSVFFDVALDFVAKTIGDDAVVNKQQLERLRQLIHTGKPAMVALGKGSIPKHAVVAFAIEECPVQDEYTIHVYDPSMTTALGPGQHIIRLTGRISDGTHGYDMDYFYQGDYNTMVVEAPGPFSPEDPEHTLAEWRCRLMDGAIGDLQTSGYMANAIYAGTLNQGSTSATYQYQAMSGVPFAISLNWGGSTLRLTLRRPNGSLYSVLQSSAPPLLVEVQDPEAGVWEFDVIAVEVPQDGYPYAVAAGSGPAIRLLLPLVLKGYSPELVDNPGFEAGDLSGWQQGGALNRRAVTDIVHTGRYAALLGDPDAPPCNASSGNAWIEQQISVPSSGTATLSLWHRLFTYDRNRGLVDVIDYLDILLNGRRIERVANESLPYSCDGPPNDLQWQRLVCDLSGYRGQEVRLRVALASTDEWYNTWAFIDDVEVKVY